MDTNSNVTHEKDYHIYRKALSFMKTIENKEILVGADFAGCSLKNAVVKHLKAKGWKITDVGVLTEDEKNPEMYHRVGFTVGAMITEGEFERALLFCGTGMGIHLAANKCPNVQCAVVESIPAALRCVAANGCNVMAMGAYYVTPRMGMAMVDAFLEHKLGDGYEDWHGFYEYHKIGYDEIDKFDFDEYKANNFKLKSSQNVELGLQPHTLVW